MRHWSWAAAISLTIAGLQLLGVFSYSPIAILLPLLFAAFWTILTDVCKFIVGFCMVVLVATLISYSAKRRFPDDSLDGERH